MTTTETTNNKKRRLDEEGGEYANRDKEKRKQDVGECEYTKEEKDLVCGDLAIEDWLNHLEHQWRAKSKEDNRIVSKIQGRQWHPEDKEIRCGDSAVEDWLKTLEKKWRAERNEKKDKDEGVKEKDKEEGGEATKELSKKDEGEVDNPGGQHKIAIGRYL